MLYANVLSEQLLLLSALVPCCPALISIVSVHAFTILQAITLLIDWLIDWLIDSFIQLEAIIALMPAKRYAPLMAMSVIYGDICKKTYQFKTLC